MMRTIGAVALATDRALMSASRRVQRVLVALTVVACAWVALPHLPRPVLDYARVPALSRLTQPAQFGTDTIADVYAARVVVHDPRDMYTKRLEQTPLEAATWSRAASAPYPPATLFSFAAIYLAGQHTTAGFAALVLCLACLFLGLSAVYCLRTRWYLFPLMAVNAPYIAERFVHVQDDSYLLMLIVLMAALFCAARRPALTHALVSLAIVLKLSPLFYLKNVIGARRLTLALAAAIVVAGLLLPALVWDGYLSIYTYQTARKAHYWSNAIGTLLLVVVFAATLAYVEARRGFDLEDRVGWDLVPVALLFAISLNASRHLFLVLLVPDKRGPRTIAGAVGMAVHLAFPSVVPIGGVTYVTAALLSGILLYHLREIGSATIHDDLRHPLRTARLLLAPAAGREQEAPA
jgi:uncharacterized membrane protein YdcZ (DUF606 family)